MDWTFILVETLLIYTVTVESQSGDEVKRLVGDLFNTYDKYVRPSKNQSIPLDVEITFHLAGINKLDEIAETFSTTAFLEVAWTDDYLTWNSAKYDDIEAIHYPQNNIWKPDLSLSNGVLKMVELGSSFVNANIRSNGRVTWHPYQVFDSGCSVDMTYFPFDKQTCDLEFNCWNSASSEVDLKVGKPGIEINGDMSSNSEWELVDLSSTVTRQGIKVRVTFSITIKRKTQYFILNVIIPVVLLSVLNVFTFVIPCDSGERISYAITVWLSFAVYLSVINSTLPEGSNSTSRLGIYIITQLFLNTTVVLLTTIQLRIQGFSDEKKIPVCLKWLPVCFKKRGVQIASTDKTPQEDVPKKRRNISWKDVVSANDFVLFWCFLTIVSIVTIACFCSL